MGNFFKDLEDVFKGGLEHGKQIWKGIEDDPERLFLGAADPFSSKMWGGITGKEYDPLISQMGGATSDQIEAMGEKGLNTKAIGNAYKIADTVAGILGGYYGGQAAGLWGGNNMAPVQEITVGQGSTMNGLAEGVAGDVYGFGGLDAFDPSIYSGEAAQGITPSLFSGVDWQKGMQQLAKSSEQPQQQQLYSPSSRRADLSGLSPQESKYLQALLSTTSTTPRSIFAPRSY